MFFEELDGYVDGGVLANNPSSCALTVIQEMYSKKEQKLPISLMVSVGTGIPLNDKLGRIDAQEFLTFGPHWLNAEDKLFTRAANLKTLLATAVSTGLLNPPIAMTYVLVPETIGYDIIGNWKSSRIKLLTENEKLKS